MKFPTLIKKGDTIGICAPSMGVNGLFEKRIDQSIRYFKSLDYQVIESESLRSIHKLTSAPAKIRAEELMQLYENDDIKLIVPPWGGQFLIDILDYMDFEKIKSINPKWIMGFSDTSTLLFVLTTMCDIATIHGPNALDFGCKPIDESVLTVFNMSTDFTQQSLTIYQKEWGDVNEDVYVPYQLTEFVLWDSLDGNDHVFTGRLIGGCLDTICKLIGTRYDYVQSYIDRYKDNGIIWYFESCAMNAADIYITLFQMKMNDYFAHCKGFIFGRPDGYSDVDDFNLIDAYSILSDLNVPVIYNADIGHLPPQLTLINGSIATVEYKHHQGQITQKMVK